MASFKAWVQGVTEAKTRQLLAYRYEQTQTGKAKTGVVAGYAVSATTPSASGSVVVGVGLAVCQPSTSGGVFEMPNDADTTFDVFTANPMQFVNNPRNDIVGVDQATGNIAVLTGVSGAIPSDPTVPTSFVPLARLRHAANATDIPAAKIDDLRSWVGPAPSNATWVDLPKAGGVAGTLKYRVRGNTVDIAIDVTGSFPSGFTAVSTSTAIPSANRPTITPARAVSYVGSGTALGSVEVLTTGAVNIQVPAGTATVAKANFSYPAG